MSNKLQTLAATAIIVLATTAANAATRPHSKTILIESPENTPVLAQANADAMYLHETGAGRTLLYVEAQNGRQLTTLDVTDPATIKNIAQTEIAAPSAYDFVQSVGENAELIRYRNGAGTALLSFQHGNKPVLVASSATASAEFSEPIGSTGLLVTAAEVKSGPVSVDPNNFEVVDTTNPSQPGVLAEINDVQQRVTKSDTGTIFLLNQHGITVVRQPQVELERQMQEVEEEHN